ncbi:MAG TPA: histidinol-phosphate transaminase [Gemmatimonadaceae bacterium]|jgi:histidinol-phosphate aminotransferase
MTARSPRALTRADYRDLGLYAPDRTPCPIDLSDNTNLWGVPPSAALAIRDVLPAAVTRYPAVYAGRLKEALARYAGVRPDEIVTGCGSDDVLDSAFRAFAQPGDGVAYPDPSFAMVPTFARLNGLDAVGIPLTRHFDLDAAAMLATHARILYICSPNNPTGTAISRSAIEHVIANTSGVVILDEAYAEFMGRGWIAEAPRRGNVLVARTMSKAFGLAGLRVGYASGDRDLVAAVEKSRGPYKVNAVAERAALAALEKDLDWVRARIDEARVNRESFRAALHEIGLGPLHSASNFVLAPVPHAVAVARRMREAGVAVRPFPALRGIGDAVRITIGPWSLMEAARDALAEALSCT